MVYRRATGNIRRPRRRVTRRVSVRRRRPVRRTYRRRRTYSKPVAMQEITPSTKFALAQLDPFEPACLGAKVPDSNTMPSIANSDTDLVALTNSATAGQLCAWAFTPEYAMAVRQATPGGLSVTWDNNAVARTKASSVNASVEAIRPVAHAVRLSCPLAPTSTTGFVHIGLDVESRFSDTASSNPEYPTTVAQMAGLAHYKRVTLASLTQSPLTVINKWIDETGFRYNDPRSYDAFNGAASGGVGSTSLFNFGSSWGALIVMVESSPGSSSTILSSEHLLMTECLPKKDAFILGSNAAPNSPALLSATSSMVAQQDFAHTEAEQESYIGRGVNHLINGLASGGRQIFNEYAPGILNSIGNRVGSAAANFGLQAILGVGGIAGVNNNPNRLALT